MGIGVGMIGLAFNQPAIAILGFIGGILHIINHFIFKTCSFMVQGVVYIKAGTAILKTWRTH